MALVLTDQWTPGMTGIEFLDRVLGPHPEAQWAVLIAAPWRPGDEQFHHAIGRWSTSTSARYDVRTRARRLLDVPVKRLRPPRPAAS